MKKIFIKILRRVLKDLARLTILRYKPKIIGVTGSVGKTSTKTAIYTVLNKYIKTRASYGNLNNDLGLPLVILGDWEEKDLKLISRETPSGQSLFKKFSFWLKVIFKSLGQIIFKNHNYPQVLVLEYGADRPGDIKYLLSIAKPIISVITAIGEVPAHIEFYNSKEELAIEKSQLITVLPSWGFAILNSDDETVMSLVHRTKAKILTFGFNEDADISIINFENKFEDGKPWGEVFKLKYGNNIFPIRIHNTFGKTHAYACGASALVGMCLNLNLISIAEALEEGYVPPKSRANIIKGIKNTLIIDDCYNASLLSMSASLELLASFPVKRKIAILGDMLEIGKYSIFAHEKIGEIAAKTADILITIGPRAKFIAAKAKECGLKQKNILSFETAEEAIDPIINLIKENDLILLKASNAMKFYKIKEAIQFVEPLEVRKKFFED
jgi:UDP-N-acetylmuramoyl-tripeptide--D-alanyl-D-alanine ligase